MAFNLTIDQGNSTAKLALWDEDGRLVDTETRMRFVARDVAAVFPDKEIDNAIYCSVSRRPPTMLRALQHRIRHVVEFHVSTPTPLKVDYRTPDTLGLDRLAAAVGAFTMESCRDKELLVVDLGTAITYDRVSADGHYKGGNIAPGIYMRLRALNHYTARLPLVDPRDYKESPLWGDDTSTALLAGAMRGVVAELEYYRERIGAETAVVLSGGCAENIAPLLSFRPVIEPNLVSLGLNRILQFNSKP